MKITVLGHINPDTDSTCSAIVYAWFLQNQGHEAEACVAGALNKEAQFVLDHFQQTPPRLLTELTAEHTLALVDTNNPEELLPGWDQAKLVSIVDHHKLVGGLTSAEPISIFMRPLACTATLLLELMDNAHLTPPAPIAGLMVAAILSDTLKFTSPTTTELDSAAASRLAEIAGIDTHTFADSMFAAKSDLTGMSLEDILSVDSKVFTLGSEKLRISVLETTNPSQVIAQREALQSSMETAKASGGLTGAIFFVIDILQNSAEAIVPSEHERDLLARAFNLPFTGSTLSLPGVVSRKKQIVPKLEAVLA